MEGIADGEMQWWPGDPGAYSAEPISSASALSPREREVLQWVAVGKTNWEIGKILHISAGTVRRHLENIYIKLGVHSRLAAVLMMLGQVTEFQ